MPKLAIDCAKKIRDFSRTRQVVGVMDAMQGGITANMDPAEIAGAAIDALDEIAASNVSISTSRMDFDQASQIAVERMQTALQNPGKLTGISTGLADLDAKTSGLQRGELLILAGRPGMGKTAVGVCVAKNVAEQSIPVDYYSLEMGAASLAFRVIADQCFDYRGPIEYFRIAKGELTDEQAGQVVEAQRQLRSIPLKIDQQDGLTVSQIAARARK